MDKCCQNLDGVPDGELKSGCGGNCRHVSIVLTIGRMKDTEYALKPKQTAMTALMAVKRMTLHQGMSGVGVVYWRTSS